MCASAFDGGRVCVSGDKGGESGEKRHFRLTRRLFHQHIKADELAALLCLCLMPFTLTLLAALLLMLLFFLFHSPAASRSLTEPAANLKPATSLCDDLSILNNKLLLDDQ